MVGIVGSIVTYDFQILAADTPAGWNALADAAPTPTQPPGFADCRRPHKGLGPPPSCFGIAETCPRFPSNAHVLVLVSGTTLRMMTGLRGFPLQAGVGTLSCCTPAQESKWFAPLDKRKSKKEETDHCRNVKFCGSVVTRA